MKNYRVTIYFSQEFEVEAKSEEEAQNQAHKQFINDFNCIPVPDEYEVECLDEDNN